MSGPTKIYLAFVALLALIWAGATTFIAAKEPGLRFTSDPDYLLENADRCTAMLRGRVDVRDANGDAIAPPEGTLVVEVRARDTEGEIAVRRIGHVQPDGVFEVVALPHGFATVSVQLGGGETVWRAEDVVVGGAGTLDPRIDPIDLGTDLVGFDLLVRGPFGDPVTTGQLAWRRVGATSAHDDMRFDGIAPIGPDGRARFLTTSDAIDVVSLVPGARTEFFEELYFDSEIDLGPGTTLELSAGDELPDPNDWRVRAILVPVELEPQIEVSHLGFGADGTDVQGGRPIFAELDLQAKSVSIPMVRAGRYRLTWTARQRRGGHRFKTTKLQDSGEDIVLTSEAGAFRVERPFPMEEFLRRAPRPR